MLVNRRRRSHGKGLGEQLETMEFARKTRTGSTFLTKSKAQFLQRPPPVARKRLSLSALVL
ncbi:hypothetical protein BN844_0176 [Pseudomonas sp. SHC52]|nr:hypothetical protein BN844_0176 [Pseudomonas sp. SHC52]